MATNQFESSRISGGTLNPGGQKATGTARDAPFESDAISRNDIRDGVEKAPAHDPKNNRPVLAASTIAGDRVRNGAGEDLGKIEEIMLDVPTGRIAYAVISFGGFLGIGDKLFAVPWKALQIDTAEHEFSMCPGKRSKPRLVSTRIIGRTWPIRSSPVRYMSSTTRRLTGSRISRIPAITWAT